MEPTLNPESENRTGTIEAAVMAPDAFGLMPTATEPAAASNPRSGKYHAIDDKELKGFVRLGRSVPVSLSALFLGVSIGFALSVFGIFQQVVSRAGLTGMTDTLVLAVCVLCLGLSVIATLLSRRSHSKLSKTIEIIRKRPKI